MITTSAHHSTQNTSNHLNNKSYLELSLSALTLNKDNRFHTTVCLPLATIQKRTLVVCLHTNLLQNPKPPQSLVLTQTKNKEKQKDPVALYPSLSASTITSVVHVRRHD